VIQEAGRQGAFPAPLIAKVNHYYLLRNSLIHERATQQITDAHVRDYRGGRKGAAAIVQAEVPSLVETQLSPASKIYQCSYCRFCCIAGGPFPALDDDHPASAMRPKVGCSRRPSPSPKASVLLSASSLSVLITE
jgi:hypothetical protein